MKNKIVIGCLLCSMSASATSYLPSSSNLTTGASNTKDNSFAASSNPAMAAYSVNKENFKNTPTNIWSSGGYTEFGPVENLGNDIQTLVDTLNKENLTLDEATALQTDGNAILKKIGDQGYFIAGGKIHMPTLPLVSSALGGSLVFDFNTSFLGYTRLLDDPLSINLITNAIGTASSVYLKGALINEVSMDYSRHVTDALGGAVYAGVKAKLLSASLTKSVVKLEGLAASDNAGQDILNELTGSNLSSSTGFGIDVGVIYAQDSFHLGLSFLNINSPTFDYGVIGGDCSALTGTEQENCNAANAFSTEINLAESFIMSPQGKIDAGFDTSKNGWRLLASLDLNAINDPVGNLIQNATVSITDIGTSSFLPNFRAGLTQNLVGTGLTWVSGGMTFWDFWQWDISFTLDSINVEGIPIPRGIKNTFGLEISF